MAHLDSFFHLGGQLLCKEQGEHSTSYAYFSHFVWNPQNRHFESFVARVLFDDY